MNSSINIQFNSTLGNKKSSQNTKLTPQQEYWLNRFLRDYSGKITTLFILFFAILFGLIYFATANHFISSTSNININISQ